MIHSSLKPAKDFNISKFYMWRCVVAMAHADGMIHDAEADWLKKMFHNMKERAGLPEEHFQTLLNDLEKQQDIAVLLAHINDPKYRAQVIYFSRLLAYKDGELHPSEDQLLQKLHLHVTEGLDMDTIRAEVRQNVGQDLVLHEVEMDSQRPTEGLFGLIDRLALHFGIDLMDE